MRLPETSLLHVFWRKCRTPVWFTFFSLLLIFTLHWRPLAFLILSPRLQSFHVVLPTKKMSHLLFFSLSFAGLPPTFSFSQCLSLALYSKCVDMTINLLSLIPRLSVFVFIDSLVVSALQDAGGYAISRQNNLELHLGCHTC